MTTIEEKDRELEQLREEVETEREQQEAYRGQ
jgi:hypothetical protein